jgi:hypothetical protein
MAFNYFHIAMRILRERERERRRRRKGRRKIAIK